jgi:leucyl-tRNA synthetase
MSKHVEPSPYQNEESHEQLMAAFREYFKANQDWQNRGTRAAGERMRYWLAQIRIIAKTRRQHVQQYRVWLDREKLARRLGQNTEGTDQDSAN